MSHGYEWIPTDASCLVFAAGRLGVIRLRVRQTFSRAQDSGDGSTYLWAWEAIDGDGYSLANGEAISMSRAQRVSEEFVRNHLGLNGDGITLKP